MKKIIAFSTLMLLSTVIFAQNKTVTFDYANNNFNDNRPLPAGENFTINGNINEHIEVVSLAIFKSHRRTDTLYSTKWRRPVGSQTGRFSIPVDFKLHGNKQYDIVLHFYRKVEDSGRLALLSAIRGNLNSYLQSVMEVNSRKVSIQSSVNTVIKDMNQIVYSGLSYYESYLPGAFPGFSDIVKSKVQQLKNQKITHARYNVKHDSAVETSQIRQKYSEKLQKQLLEAAVNEVAPFINDHLAVLEDKRERDNYPTEEINRTLSLNAGYGGVYLSGKWDDMDYDSGPYVGLSFPLGNESISPFWGRTSISLGVFLKNFKDKDGNKITGPVVGLPYFVGLGYKFLHVVRLQAGVVATSTEEIDNISNITTKNVQLKPFVGLSAEINLWLGFDQKK